jgi:hypothetical protein
MPKPNALVDQVVALSSSAPLHGRGQDVTFAGGRTAYLDPNDKRSPVWAAILDELRQEGSPVYIEIDPTNDGISELLLPATFYIEDLQQLDTGDYDVTFLFSHARHFLRQSNPDFRVMLDELQNARRNGLTVAVTETPVDHEIIDVRPPVGQAVANLGPVTGGLAKGLVSGATAPPSTAPRGAGSGATGGGGAGPTPPITFEQAAWFFSLVDGESCVPPLAPLPGCIPFLYPDNGCNARAHAMSRLILANGGLPSKAWNYGSLTILTKNHPCCSWTWKYHVALSVDVTGPDGTSPYIIDPSMHRQPVPLSTWIADQHDPASMQATTTPDVFYLSSDGVRYLDPAYQWTKELLAYYRRQLQLRCASAVGCPPYARCP